MSKRVLCGCGEYHPADNHPHLGTANPGDAQAVASSHHVKALQASGFAFKLQNAGTLTEVALFRDPRGPGVDFWPRRGQWRLVGKGVPATTFQGGAQAFLAWYRKRWAKT
jgi:hypothetical protein